MNTTLNKKWDKKIFHGVLFFLGHFLFFSCSHSQTAQNPVLKSAPNETTVPTVSIRPGEVLFISLHWSGGEQLPLFCKDQEIKYKIENNKLEAFLSESYFTDEKPYNCFFNKENIKLSEINRVVAFRVEVIKKEFPREKLNVNPKKVFLSVKDKMRVKKEQEMLNKIYAESSTEFLFHKGFEIPLSTKVTSIYGTKRVFNNNYESQHLGTDYRASVGVPIPASNAGRVVLASDLFYTGNTVILDHGLGVFTMYGHLSKLLVKKDDFVLQGQEIGLSGNTGRASGPHLHWGVKVHKEWVDGDSLVATTQNIWK